MAETSPDYLAFMAQRHRAMGLPFAGSSAYRRTGPTPVIGGGGGTGTAVGTNPAHVGGDTWEMNSNRGGMQFNGPSTYRGSAYGGGGPTIHGYEGGGLNTRDFSQLMGRGPTAADVEMANGGGLAPNHPQMGSLDSYYSMARGPSQWQQLQMGVPQGAPQSGVSAGNGQGTTFDPNTGSWVPSQGGSGQAGLPLPLMSNQNPVPQAPSPFHYTPDQPWLLADKSSAQKDFDTGFRMADAGRGTAPPLTGGGGLINPPPAPYHSGPSRSRPLLPMLADGGEAKAGQPVIVGERGPEMMVPTEDVTVIPNEYLPSQHLRSGDIMQYLKRFLR